MAKFYTISVFINEEDIASQTNNQSMNKISNKFPQLLILVNAGDSDLNHQMFFKK